MADTRTVAAALRHVAEWHPDRIAFAQAFADGDERITFEETHDRAKRVANALAARGIEPGDRVAFLSRSTVDHVTAYLALAEIGAVGAPMHAREAPAELGALVEYVDADAVVFHPDYADVVDRIGAADGDRLAVALDRHDPAPADIVGLSTLLEEGEAADTGVTVSPDDVAYINFTSGTTGRSKGIVHTHEEVIESAQLSAYFLSIRPEDTFLNARSPSFIGWSVWQYALLAVGATTVFLAEWEPAAVARAIEAEAVTLVTLTPTQWKMVLRASVGDHDLDTIRLATYAGETMSPALLEELRDRVTEHVSTIYGSTETMGSGVGLDAAAFTEDTMDSIGKPLPTVDARVIEPGSGDPAARVPRGDVGELIIRGPSVAETVWDDPERTRETFHPEGWWFSGDLARIGDGGNVYLEGRADNMIISGGINIHAENVEASLEAHPGVLEAAVIGVPHDTWNEAVKAVVIRSDDELTAEMLDEWWRDRDDLADYRRPREYAFRSELPRSVTGKLDRGALRDGDSDG